MIKVSVMYPNSDGCKFDFDYYCKSHLPMVQDKLGAACTGIAADKGMAGGAPGTKPTYVAVAHLFFESVDAFKSAFGPHADAIMADIPNYTNVQPEVQISEVMVNASRSDKGPLRPHLH